MKTWVSPGAVTYLTTNLLQIDIQRKFFTAINSVQAVAAPDMWEPKPPKGFVSPKGEKKSITEPRFFFDFPGKFRLIFVHICICVCILFVFVFVFVL